MTLNQLLGNPDLPLEQFPEYAQAKAALDSAQRDFDHTIVRAPMSGTATQVDNIQLGRFVTAGTPVLSVIDDHAPWVDANPKETDITFLRVGHGGKALMNVDNTVLLLLDHQDGLFLTVKDVIVAELRARSRSPG